MSNPSVSYLWFDEKNGWQVTSFDPETDEAIGYHKRRNLAKEYVSRIAYEELKQDMKKLVEALKEYDCAYGLPIQIGKVFEDFKEKYGDEI